LDPKKGYLHTEGNTLRVLAEFNILKPTEEAGNQQNRNGKRPPEVVQGKCNIFYAFFSMNTMAFFINTSYWLYSMNKGAHFYEERAFSSFLSFPLLFYNTTHTSDIRLNYDRLL
jgi:hypothetical protein